MYRIGIFVALSLLSNWLTAQERVAVPLNDFQRLGQVFVATEPFNILWLAVASWNDNEGGFTLTLWDSPKRTKLLASKAFKDIPDNSWVVLTLPETMPPGSFYWEISERTGRSLVGLYAERTKEPTDECAYFDGIPQKNLKFIFGVRFSPYVGAKRLSWVARTKQPKEQKRLIPQWIWFPEIPIPSHVIRYFRRTFNLPRLPQKAILRVTGDDGYTFWVNGEKVAEGGQPFIKEVEVTNLLHKGKNVLAASVYNAIPPAGLLVELILTFPSGGRQRIFSDAQWRASDIVPEGWLLPNFDDSGWSQAMEIGDVYRRPWYGTGNISKFYPLPEHWQVLRQLSKEPPAKAEVKTERGAPRLFVNGKEIFPLFAGSEDLLEFASDFAYAGIEVLHPLYNLSEGWLGPGKYDWKGFENLLSSLLIRHPRAFFLVRIGLFAPRWWCERYPQELVRYALPLDEQAGHWAVRSASFASEQWRKDASDALRSFLRFVEHSPLKSRIIGYQIANGIFGEWHYFGARYLPDLSEPMQRACGFVPDASLRLKTVFGLLRDPTQDKSVIEFYQRFHKVCAETLLQFARIVKAETRGRVLCGAFYTYLLENLWIQEGGHLAPELVLNSRDIDFIACPYTYQGDAFDACGNWLGRARGVGGDGGYRVLLESLKRHGKLYFAEIDPSTSLEVQPELMGNGGPGTETLEGSRLVLRRDLVQMMTQGNGGWLFDLGQGWYAEKALLDEVRAFVNLGKERCRWNLSSVAQIAAVYDPHSFFVTAHWKAVPGAGEYDLFGDYFLNRQARAIHRIGAPVDFLDHADLTSEDAKRYRLLLMVNCFYLTDEETEKLKRLFEGSGATVVWFYASGFVAPEGLTLDRMEQLTGMKFKVLREPGEMVIEAGGWKFGVPGRYFPRFVVDDREAEILGVWADNRLPAFARKKLKGWTSVYVGTAPLPTELLRMLARYAGVNLWTDRPSVVYAAKDCAAVIVSEAGKLRISFPRPLRLWQSRLSLSREFLLDCKQGEVLVFVP